MGSYRSPYSLMPESNRNSTPNFQWFHPSFFSSSRNGFNPFQGTQHTNSNIDAGGGGHGAICAIPVRSLIPPPEAVHNEEDDVELAARIQPSTKAKKPKTSKKPPTDGISPKPMKPRQTSKDSSSKPKKTKTASSSSTAKRERKDLNLAIYEGNVDLTGIPAPFCSCTGAARQCYRWGAGGWQSSCCTTNVSEYPLPMSVTRPGSRMAGRKMSHGAYEKLIQRLTAGGYDLSHSIDLKQHWARHGTNKFVTIK